METHLLLPLMTRLIMLQKGSRMNPSGASLVGKHVATKEAADSDKGGVKCIRSSAQNVEKIQLSLSSQEAIAQFTAVIASVGNPDNLVREEADGKFGTIKKTGGPLAPFFLSEVL